MITSQDTTGGQLESDAHEESLRGQQQLAVESNDGTVAPKEATKRGRSRKNPAILLVMPASTPPASTQPTNAAGSPPCSPWPRQG